MWCIADRTRRRLRTMHDTMGGLSIAHRNRRFRLRSGVAACDGAPPLLSCQNDAASKAVRSIPRSTWASEPPAKRACTFAAR